MSACADDAARSLQHQMPNHSIAHNNGPDLIAICTAVIVEEMKSQAYIYTLHTTKEVPCTLANLYSAGVFAGESQAMMCVAPKKLPVTLPASSPAVGRRMRGRQEE